MRKDRSGLAVDRPDGHGAHGVHGGILEPVAVNGVTCMAQSAFGDLGGRGTGRCRMQSLVDVEKRHRMDSIAVRCVLKGGLAACEWQLFRGPTGGCRDAEGRVRQNCLDFSKIMDKIARHGKSSSMMNASNGYSSSFCTGLAHIVHVASARRKRRSGCVPREPSSTAPNARSFDRAFSIGVARCVMPSVRRSTMGIGSQNGRLNCRGAGPDGRTRTPSPSKRTGIRPAQERSRSRRRATCASTSGEQVGSASPRLRVMVRKSA